MLVTAVPPNVSDPMLNAPAVTDKFPVLAPVAVVVPRTNASALSSQIIAALSPVEPLSNINPISLLLAPVSSLCKPINAASTYKF